MWLGVDFNTEGIEGQEVGWQAYQKGNYVNGENNFTPHHCLHYEPKPKEANKKQSIFTKKPVVKDYRLSSILMPMKMVINQK